MDALPTTDPEVVHNCQADYDAAFRSASQDEVDSARFRLEHPDCRQAEALQKLCDDCILRDGLLGVGVGLGATLLGIGLAVLFSSKK
ncbi:uncharacterized protein HaLaN_18404 [Haematococcus lacustris]|uniref:Uncharacterized protein n=1 Tax=Haematococcus lacustris TaxID=44745 RepID=A0A699ZG21_HAELA|nr:uncharacterized protein HaLaN_18404 [Haematococcus lacustris]